MDLVSLPLAFAAGLVSILNPCVLPLVPVVLGTAVSEHRWGPVALVAGVALSFLALGLFVAVIGFSIGLDAQVFRVAAALILVLVGALLLVPATQYRFAAVAAPGYQGPKMATVVARTGVWKLEIIKRSELQRFLVLPRRWAVERTLASISRNRRLSRDFERYARTVAAFIRLAMIGIMLKRLTRPSPGS